MDRHPISRKPGGDHTSAGYRERLLSATEDDTVFLDELFDVGWRKAPHRVLRNKTIDVAPQTCTRFAKCVVLHIPLLCL
jgi:hypothetical protein